MAQTQSGDMLDEPTSPIHPIARFPPLILTSAEANGATESETKQEPVKRASRRLRESRGRAPEFYGFVAWLVTILVYLAYLLWTFLPDELIRILGIEWYPARFVVEVPLSTFILSRL